MVITVAVAVATAVAALPSSALVAVVFTVLVCDFPIFEGRIPTMEIGWHALVTDGHFQAGLHHAGRNMKPTGTSGL
ncbi:MAG: hypothetical protein K8S94_09180 [Planctomycetia bacterium]|nr:hypothetical protein [Planctomycetia bacterium]